MSRRSLLVAVLVCVTLGAVSWRTPALRAADGDLVTVGQVYGFIVDCIPATAAAMLGTETCFAEPLMVREVRADGWLRVEDQRGGSWLINLARVYAIQAVVAGRRQA